MAFAMKADKSDWKYIVEFSSGKIMVIDNDDYEAFDRSEGFGFINFKENGNWIIINTRHIVRIYKLIDNENKSKNNKTQTK